MTTSICRSSAPAAARPCCAAAGAVERGGARGVRRAVSHRRLGRPIGRRPPPQRRAAAVAGRRARGSGHRLGGADGRRPARRPIAAEAAISARARRAAAKRRATAAPMMNIVSRLLPDAPSRRSRRRGRATPRRSRTARRLLSARLGRRRGLPASAGQRRRRSPRDGPAHDGRLHHVAHGRGRSGNSIGRDCPGPARPRIVAAAARLSSAQSWRASAPARSSLKSMNITRPPAGSTAAPASAKWDAARATTRAAPPLWCCAATSADVRQGNELKDIKTPREAGAHGRARMKATLLLRLALSVALVLGFCRRHRPLADQRLSQPVRSSFSSASVPAAAATSSPESSRRKWPKASANRSSLRTVPARAAWSQRPTWRSRRPTVTC